MTKRQYVRSLYRRSNPNSLVRFPSRILSVPHWNQQELPLYINSHINNFVSVLILRDLDVCGGVLILENLDVLGLLVDLLMGDWFRFSTRSC